MRQLLAIGGPNHGEQMDFPDHSTCMRVVPKEARPAYDLDQPKMSNPFEQTGTYWPQKLRLGTDEVIEVLVWFGWDR